MVYHKHKRPRCRPREVHLVIWEKLSTLQSVPQRDQLTDGNNGSLDSPCTPESPALSVLISGTDEDSRQCSRETSTQASSTRTSLSSADNVSPYSGGKQRAKSTQVPPLLPLSHHNSRDVKGLRNISRYEPYISRRFRKTKETVNTPSPADESSDTSKGYGSSIANTPTEDGRSPALRITMTSANSNSGVETKITTSPPKDNRATISLSHEESGSSKHVCFDFLKGVLSDNDLMFSHVEVGGSLDYTSPPEDIGELNDDSDGAAGEEEEMNILNELFND